MPLDIPNHIALIALGVLVAGNFKLLESPLRQVDVVALEQAARSDVTKAETGGESVDFGGPADVGVLWVVPRRLREKVIGIVQVKQQPTSIISTFQWSFISPIVEFP